MPEAYTHIRIARKAREELAKAGAQPARTAAYEMGANGPDPLFAYKFLSGKKPYPLPVLGERMHTEQCGRFLRALVFRAYTDAQRSYALGFLTHYAADAALHPYVASQTQPGAAFDVREGHGFCEVAMDTYFHEKDGLGPMVGAQDSSPALAPDELADVTALLRACAQEVYGEDVPQEYLADAFHDFCWLHGKVFAASRAKRAALWLAERVILRKPGRALSHLTPAPQPAGGFAARWTDPFTGVQREEGPDALCAGAAGEAVRLCAAAVGYWRGAVGREQLAVAIGDRSYATGQLSDPAPDAAPPCKESGDLTGNS